MKVAILMSTYHFLGIFGYLPNNHIKGFSTKLQTLRGNVKFIIKPDKNLSTINSNMSSTIGVNPSLNDL